MSCQHVYHDTLQALGGDRIAAHMAAEQAYTANHPDEPDGCYWCGDRAHRSIECPKRGKDD